MGLHFSPFLSERILREPSNLPISSCLPSRSACASFFAFDAGYLKIWLVDIVKNSHLGVPWSLFDLAQRGSTPTDFTLLLVAMRVAVLLSLAVFIACALSASAMVRQSVEAYVAPVTYTKRGLEYYIDPIGPASSIYSTIVQVGGQNYRLIMVRCRFDSFEGCDTVFRPGQMSNFPPRPLMLFKTVRLLD